MIDCIENGRTQRAYIAGTKYVAFCDPSSGSKDSFALAVAHAKADQAVLDVALEVRARFDPVAVVGQLAETLRAYNCRSVTGNRYAQGFVVSAFQKAGIAYVHSQRNRSEIYLAAPPLINARRVQLLDSTRLVNQLAGLQRRTSSSGKQTVDHMRNGADDLSNAACGAVVLTTDAAAMMKFGMPVIVTAPRFFPGNVYPPHDPTKANGPEYRR